MVECRYPRLMRSEKTGGVGAMLVDQYPSYA